MFWRSPLDRNRLQIPFGVVQVIDERCKGCGICVEFCPKHLLVISEHTNSKGYHPPKIIEDQDCVNCGLCALLCPDFAIYVEDGGKRTPDKVISIRGSGNKPWKSPEDC
ncbi:MAG: 4Fe-4S binding protein [Anaerolineales bacterium]|nr:4Fe-4S binding protein [Anaerolineales bacterium]